MEISSRERGPGGPGFQIVTGGHSKHGQTFFFSRLRVHKIMQGTVMKNSAKVDRTPG